MERIFQPLSDQISFAGHAGKYPHLPVSLEALGVHHLQEHVDRPVGIDSWQWVQSVQGKGELHLNGKSYALEAGSGVILPIRCSHVYYGITNPWYVNFLCVSGSLIQEITSLLGLSEAGVYHLAQPQEILDYEDEIFSLCMADSSQHAFEISQLLYALLLKLSAAIKNPSASSGNLGTDVVHNAICFMGEHHSEAIGLSDIASHVGLSREYLCQLFKRSTSSTVLQYLTQIRLAEAKTALLRFPHKTVDEIARMCGFETPSYFCYVFKKNEHMTPSQFRQTRR